MIGVGSLTVLVEHPRDLLRTTIPRTVDAKGGGSHILVRLFTSIVLDSLARYPGSRSTPLLSIYT